MTRTEAIKVALCALSAQVQEGKHYLKYEHSSSSTCEFWQSRIEEAQAAYDELLTLLKENQNNQGEA